ncbi:MAG: cbb3-type cytochrome oxidase assembly protein CcoS [Rubrivivax sp.]|nr:cbb3-type cytochrome oxidase assembly protein CcoS [Rubrivivax sp.]
MNILLALIPVTIVMLIVAGIAFFWAVDHGQFDDMDSPALLPLLDDPGPGKPPPPAESGPP